MREYRFAVATAAATFLLLVIGGLVHPTGSSLACQLTLFHVLGPRGAALQGATRAPPAHLALEAAR
jgi:hypothetical protein